MHTLRIVAQCYAFILTSLTMMMVKMMMYIHKIVFYKYEIAFTRIITEYAQTLLLHLHVQLQRTLHSGSLYFKKFIIAFWHRVILPKTNEFQCTYLDYG